MYSFFKIFNNRITGLLQIEQFLKFSCKIFNTNKLNLYIDMLTDVDRFYISDRNSRAYNIELKDVQVCKFKIILHIRSKYNIRDYYTKNITDYMYRILFDDSRFYNLLKERT